MKSIKGGRRIVDCIGERTHGSKEAVLLMTQYIHQRGKKRDTNRTCDYTFVMFTITILKHTLRFTEKEDVIGRPFLSRVKAVKNYLALFGV